MNLNSRVLRTLSLVALASFSAAVFADAGVPELPPPVLTKSVVRISTYSGRTFSGHIDSLSDEQYLRLFLAEPRAVIKMTIPWGMVRDAQIDGKFLSAIELSRLAPTLASDRPELDSLAADAARIASAPEVVSATPPPKPLMDAPEWLEVSAAIKNWDAEASPDGIELIVSPRSQRNKPLLVTGSIQVKLLARNYQHPTTRGAFPRLDQWSAIIQEQDYVDGVAIIRLPFRSGNDYLGNDLQPIGSLQVRFNTNARKILSAEAPVLLNPANPVSFDWRYPEQEFRKIGLSYLLPW